MDIGPTELIIILIIVVLVFGVGRVGKLGGELGNAIREFRQGLNGGDKEQQPQAVAKPPEAPAPAPAEDAAQAKPAKTPEG